MEDTKQSFEFLDRKGLELFRNLLFQKIDNDIIKATNENFTTLQNKIKDLESTVTSYKTRIQTLESEVNTLKEQLNNNKFIDVIEEH